MKQNNQEPMDGNRSGSRQQGVSSHLDSSRGPRFAAIQQAVGNRFSQLVSRLRDNVSRRNAMVRARLENEALPDDAASARRDQTLVNAVRPAGNQTANAETVSEQTHRLPRTSEVRTMDAQLPQDAAGSVTSGTYIDLTGPNPMNGATGMRSGDGSSAEAIAASGEAGSSFADAVGSTMRAYRKRRAADRSIRRNSRERVYRLKGYTTVAKVNRKYASERRQRLLRRVLTFIIVILTVVLLIQLYNPITDLSEWYRILGIDSLEDLPNAQNPGTTGTGGVTITPPATSVTPGATTTGSGTTATTRATTR